MPHRRLTAPSTQLTDLFGAYLQFYEVERPEDAIDHFLRANLQNPSVVLFGAFVGEDLIGFTQTYLLPNSLSLGRMGLLNDLYITPTQRGCGQGEALLRATQEHLRALGLDRLELATANTNIAGQRLYAKTGWQPDAAFTHFFRELR